MSLSVLRGVEGKIPNAVKFNLVKLILNEIH